VTHSGALHFQRQTTGEAESLFHQQRDAKQLGVAVWPPDQLDAHRQSLLRQPAGQRDGRTADQGDDEGQEHPVNISCQLLAGDLAGKALLYRERGDRHGGTDEQVGGSSKKRATRWNSGVALALRPDDLAGRELLTFLMFQTMSGLMRGAFARQQVAPHIGE